MNCITKCEVGYTYLSKSNVTYNFISDNDVNFNDAPLGVGVVVGQNGDGRDIDTYFNILSGSADFARRASYHPHFLYPGHNSPCIDAGDPMFKDPDGSRRDIGAFPYIAWVGVDELDKAESINLYPNPNSGAFNLSFAELTSGLVQVIDISGKVVFEDQIEMIDKMNLDINLKPGIYLLQVSEESGTKSAKFVVKN